MPEIINTRTPAPGTWNAIAVLADVSDDLCEEIFGKRSSGQLVVELCINGQEVSFTAVINCLKQAADQWAAIKARRLIEDRASVLTEKLHKLETVAGSIEQQVLRELRQTFPECITEEDYR